jgi:hypothetical protein
MFAIWIYLTGIKRWVCLTSREAILTIWKLVEVVLVVLLGILFVFKLSLTSSFAMLVFSSLTIKVFSHQFSFLKK